MLDALVIHEKYDSTVVSIIRALITLSSSKSPHGASNLQKISTVRVARLVVSAMKTNDDSAEVARWGCQYISHVASSPEVRQVIGSRNVCDAISSALKKHVDDADVCIYACRAIVELCKLSSNLLSYLSSSDTCVAVVGPIQTHATNGPVIDACVAAIVVIASHEPNLAKLGTTKLPLHLVTALKSHYKMTSVAKTISQAIYCLTKDAGNRSVLGMSGASYC